MLISFIVVIQLQLLFVESEINKGTGEKLLIRQIRDILYDYNYIVVFGIKSEVVIVVGLTTSHGQGIIPQLNYKYKH